MGILHIWSCYGVGVLGLQGIGKGSTGWAATIIKFHSYRAFFITEIIPIGIIAIIVIIVFNLVSIIWTAITITMITCMIVIMMIMVRIVIMSILLWALFGFQGVEGLGCRASNGGSKSAHHQPTESRQSPDLFEGKALAPQRHLLRVSKHCLSRISAAQNNLLPVRIKAPRLDQRFLNASRLYLFPRA